MSWGLRAQIDELRAEVKALKADAEWRHRWHERLGRGNLTEGKFYERVAQLKAENRDLSVRLRTALEVHQNRLDEWRKKESEFKLSLLLARQS